MTHTTKLRAGIKITIYEDPVTKKKLEGEATLLTCILRNDDAEYWTVKFDGDGGTYDRWIGTET